MNRSQPPAPPAPPNPSLLPGIIVGSAIAIGGLTLAGVIVVAALLIRGNDRPGAAQPGSVLPPAVADREQAVAADMPAGPTSERIAREEALKQKQAIEAARGKLALAGGDRPDAISAAAERLQEEIDTLRKGSDTEPGLRLRPAGGGDPRDATQRAIAAANRADEVRRLTDDAPSLLADLDAAATELAAAVAGLDAAKQQVPALAAAERQARKNKMQEHQANELATRQRDAFAAFAKEPSLMAELPAPDGVDALGVGPIKRSKSEVDLGPFPVQDLVEPSLRLAVPEETIDAVPFQAEIVPVTDDRWEIRSTQGYTGLGGRPQAFAGLVVVNGLLRLELDPKAMDKRPMAILRRCVILAEAKDPQTKQPRVREIRLVKPTKVGPLQVAASAGRQEMLIPVPAGIYSKDTPPGSTTAADLALPVSGIEITGQWGDGEKMTKRLPRDAAAADQLGLVTWPGVRVSEIGNGVAVELNVAVSLPQAMLVATPAIGGPNSRGIDLEKLAEFAEKRASSLPDVKKKLSLRVDKCPGRNFAKANGSKAESEAVRAWFTKPLATVGQMGLDLPGHETIQASMDRYLRAEYAKQQQDQRAQWEREVAAEKDENQRKKKQADGPRKPDFPRDFDDWLKRCGSAREPQWNKEFNARLSAWSELFWPVFEAHWKTTEAMATRPMQKQDLRLLEIVSVARDAEGNEYRVPLVEFDAAAPVPRGKVASDRDAPGAAPLRSTGL